MISKMKYKRLRHCIYATCLLLIPLFSIGGEREDTLFKNGNEQYAEAKYQEAINSFKEVLDAGYVSASLYYNIGNAYYKLDDIPSALLYYEKALRLAPGDEDIRFNIQLASLKTVDKIEDIPVFFLAQWWNAFILFFSIQTLAVLGILFLISTFILFVIFLYTRTMSWRKILFYTAILLLFCGLSSVFMANRQAAYFGSHQQAIIFTAAVTVKSEPENTSKSLFLIHEGTKISILDHHQGWMKVELSNGKIGWIMSSDAQEI